MDQLDWVHHNQKFFLTPFVLFMFLCTVGIAGASTITYDFTNLASSNGDLSPSPYVMVQDGLSLSITADGGTLHQNTTWGLGVNDDATDNNKVTSGEALNFDFSPFQTTILSSAVFETTLGQGHFQLLGDGVVIGEFTFGAGNRSDSVVTIDFSSYSAIASVFEFVGLDSTGGIRVQSLTVAFDPAPEPATALLLGIGLLGLAGVSRKKIVN